MYKNITVKELKEKIDKREKFILLGVRTDMEYFDFHLKNSILIPHYVVEERHEELKADKDDEIVVICRIGNRSVIAAESLVNLGYKNILNVIGGIIEWKSEGYPVEE